MNTYAFSFDTRISRKRDCAPTFTRVRIYHITRNANIIRGFSDNYTVRIVSWRDRITRWMSLLLWHFIIFSCNLLKINAENEKREEYLLARRKKRHFWLKKHILHISICIPWKKMFPSYRSARFTRESELDKNYITSNCMYESCLNFTVNCKHARSHMKLRDAEESFNEIYYNRHI